MAQRHGRWWLVGLIALFCAPALRASDTEYRSFDIFVGGKPAGESQLTIVQQDDGTNYMKATASVKLQGLIQFKFDVTAEEWWKDGKLVGLKSRATENRKQTEVMVTTDGKQLFLTVNGQPKSVGPDTWTTSYWKLADARFHNRQIPILETDTGNQFVGKLQLVGEEQITINGQLEKCYHFRVTDTQSPTDLWFDKYYRLVRQEFTESGHRTIVQLKAVRR
jgi:hypothetical protein